jgi:hypothetical protein
MFEDLRTGRRASPTDLEDRAAARLAPDSGSRPAGGAREGTIPMYIGIGTVVLIVIIVLVILMLRRR